MTNQTDITKAAPDALAYLSVAAIEIAKEQEFQPENAADFKTWVETNATVISERASFNQAALLNKLFAPRNQAAFNALRSILCAKVWARVNHQRINNEVEVTINAAIA